MQGVEPYLKQAEEVYNENFKPETWFESCIFLSEYPGTNDYDYNYWMAARELVTDPKMAKRSINSLLAETHLAKLLGWKIEFLTGNLGVYSILELADLTRKIAEVYGEKMWVNYGAFSRSQLDILKSCVKGIYGSIDTVNPDIHKRTSKDKPTEPIIRMFDDARDFDRAISIVIGLGEKIEDIALLHRLIENNKISKITFYPLNNDKGPDTFYYAKWIAQTRIRFPKIHINAGTSLDRVAETGVLLRAGANAISRFPAINMFNSEQAKIIEEEAKNAGRTFLGTLTDVNKLNIKEDLVYKDKLDRYIEVMRKSK